MKEGAERVRGREGGNGEDGRREGGRKWGKEMYDYTC